MEKKKQENKMRRDQLNDEYLELLEKQRLYFKTVKEFKEVRTFLLMEIGKCSVTHLDLTCAWTGFPGATITAPCSPWLLVAVST